MNGSGRSATQIGGGLVLNGVAGTGLLISTALRETPVFWRNAGGYPVWLRELILYFHYPLLFLVLGGTAGLTFLAARHVCHRRGEGAGLLLLCGLEWLLFAGALGLMLYNNIENLRQGRPLHYHPPR